MTQPKNKGGRPTIYTPELGKKICERIEKGEAIKKICKDNKMPNASTIFRWLLDEDKKEFCNQYEKAINTKAENMFDELLEIADEKNKDVMRARLRVDTRKWYLSKVLPKKFGEKLDMTTDGKPLNVIVPQSVADTFLNDSINKKTGGSDKE